MVVINGRFGLLSHRRIVDGRKGGIKKTAAVRDRIVRLPEPGISPCFSLYVTSSPQGLKGNALYCSVYSSGAVRTAEKQRASLAATHAGSEHLGSWRSSDINEGVAGNDIRGRSGRHGRGGKKRASGGNDAGSWDEHDELSSESYSDKSGSIGSMGSDLEAPEEDPFAAMEQDELDKKEEMEKIKRGPAAGEA